MEYLGLITIICLAVIIFLLIWNMINDRNRSKSRTGVRIDEAKYYELKYKMQYITAIFPLVIGIVALIGRKEISSISESISSSIKGQLEPKILAANNSVDSLKLISSNLSSKYQVLQRSFTELDDKYDVLSNKDEKTKAKILSTGNSAEDLSKKVNQLTNVIEKISDKDIIKNGVYVIRDVVFPKKQGDSFRYYFKDLKRSNGQNLPKFTKPPIVYIAGINYNEFKYNEITSEYVDMILWSATVEGEGYVFNMVIIE